MLEILARICYTALRMREEIPKNEDVIFIQQTAKVKQGLGNAPRRLVKPGWVITWYLMALFAVAAWAYRLLGLFPPLF